MKFLLPGFAILLVGLKLTRQVDWSWWVVIAPIWIPALLAALFLGLVFVTIVFRP